MRTFLMQPYPFSDNVRNKLLVCGGVGLFITLFLAVFEPFGFDELDALVKWQHALAFGLVTALFSSFLQTVVPILFPALFREEEWRSWKEIVFLLLTTLVIGAANYALILFLYPQSTSLSGFFRAQLDTLQVGIIPVVFLVFMKQLTLYRRFAAQAEKASAQIQAGLAFTETVLPSSVTLQGDNQKEVLTVHPDDLLFIISADNYVQVYTRKTAGATPVMLRGSLKKMEEQLASQPQFFRCHRMYLVNLRAVEAVSGNAQGLRLHLSGSDELVPVSRSLTETVRHKLQELSHSPQKTES